MTVRCALVWGEIEREEEPITDCYVSTTNVSCLLFPLHNPIADTSARKWFHCRQRWQRKQLHWRSNHPGQKRVFLRTRRLGSEPRSSSGRPEPAPDTAASAPVSRISLRQMQLSLEARFQSLWGAAGNCRTLPPIVLSSSWGLAKPALEEELTRQGVTLRGAKPLLVNVFISSDSRCTCYYNGAQ